MDKFMKPSEVALLFRVSRRAVEQWCVVGKIKAKKFEGRWLIEREALLKKWQSESEE